MRLSLLLWRVGLGGGESGNSEKVARRSMRMQGDIRVTREEL
jgi:hypothetical protein